MRRILLAAFLPLVFALSLVRLDYVPALHTYGVTIGGDSRYCSADLVSGWPEISCEIAV